MDNREYHSDPAIGKSMLDSIARSPLHYWARHVDPNRVEPTPTPAMVLGTAFHALLLERDLFETSYIAAPSVDRRTKAGKATWAELEASGKTVLSEDDLAALTGMAASVLQHPAASRLLALPGRAEVSLFYEDDATGLRCKARPDWLTDGGIIVDIKTTQDASPEAFRKSAYNFRYDVQAAHYTAAVPDSAFVFIAVEKTPPYAVAVYEADISVMQSGHARRRDNLNCLADCLERDEWPGYDSKIQPLGVPSWAVQ
jgi:exodeoxyribonuclease VIII